MNHDLSVLFSNEVPLRPFTTSNVSDIPTWGSIIYTVFLNKTEYIYVGIGGLSGKSVTERNPRSQLFSTVKGGAAEISFASTFKTSL